MSRTLYVLIALLILGVIIMIHELGHFIVGRLCGIGVTEFSVGFGPKLFSRKRKGIEYSVRALPLGGFCRFLGEDESAADPHAFNNASVWKRMLTVFAGPAMNFVLAFLAAVITLSVFGVYSIFPKIGGVESDMPAMTAGIEIGDIITAANGETVEYSYDGVLALRNIIQDAETIQLTVLRGDESIDITLVPQMSETTDAEGNPVSRRMVGVVFTQEAIRLSAFDALGYGAEYMWETTVSMIDLLRNLIFHGEGLDSVTGPVGTIAVVSEYVQSDLREIWNILFMISLNLGIMNLLPLPALDGGRLVFLVVEAIRRKPVPPEKEGIVHMIGLALLLLLTVFIFFHDIQTYILH